MHVFDPHAKWLIEHQDKRPYGDEMVLTADAAEGGAAVTVPPAGGRAQTAGGRCATSQLTPLAGMHGVY